MISMRVELEYSFPSLFCAKNAECIVKSRAKLSQPGALVGLLVVISVLAVENPSFPCICTGTI